MYNYNSNTAYSYSRAHARTHELLKENIIDTSSNAVAPTKMYQKKCDNHCCTWAARAYSYNKKNRVNATGAVQRQHKLSSHLQHPPQLSYQSATAVLPIATNTSKTCYSYGYSYIHSLKPQLPPQLRPQPQFQLRL